MADELNIPTHRWYQPRYNISLPNTDFSKQWIFNSGIQKIDNFINGGSFSPSTLFALAEPGVWFDPSDLTTLFTDPAGTTPVTAPGNTVGLMLDKSKALALGAELVSNGDFSAATGWTQGAGWSIGSGVATGTATSGYLYQAVASVAAGKYYEYTVTITSYTSGTLRFFAGSGAESLSTAMTASGTYTLRVCSRSASQLGVVGTAFTGSIDNISVRELAGNHATQATLTARPTYSIEPVGGRRNLLLWTEDFGNAAWIKSGATATTNQALNPLGTATDADKVDGAGVNGGVYATSSGNVLSGVDATISVWVKSATGSNQTIRFRGQTGVGANVFSPDITATSSWQRVSFTWTPSSTFAPTPGILTDASGAAFSVFLWGAQLELGSTATAYQRVTTQHDVTEAGVASVGYLWFNGVSNAMALGTSTITPGTDKVQVFAGVRKLNNSTGVIAELSANFAFGGASGLFCEGGPGAANNYVFGSMGTIAATAVASPFVAPITSVVTGIGDISGDRATARVNGTQVAQNTADQGTGNYLANPLYIGARGGTSLFFNGQLFPLIVRFGPNLTTARISATESWVASKTAGAPAL